MTKGLGLVDRVTLKSDGLFGIFLGANTCWLRFVEKSGFLVCRTIAVTSVLVVIRLLTLARCRYAVGARVPCILG